MEKKTFDQCGLCDVCVDKRKKENTQSVIELREEIMRLVKAQLFTVDELEARIAPADTELFVEVVRELVEEGRIKYDEVWRLVPGESIVSVVFSFEPLAASLRPWCGCDLFDNCSFATSTKPYM